MPPRDQRDGYDGVIAEPRRRLDAELVRRQLSPSREHARQVIADGEVLVNGAVAQKPANQVLPGDAILLRAEPPRFVSRAGEKLAKALDVFSIDPDGCRCLDVGSSTGGFTDCLLQLGASHVIAVDVGRAQLHEKIRSSERVDVKEQTDIRSIGPDDLGGPVDLVVCDVSFISLRLVMPTILSMIDGFGAAVVLVKPQFEAGRDEASRGRGIIRDPEVWHRILIEVKEMVESLGASVSDGTVSPIKGGAGNVEFLFLIRRFVDDDQVDTRAMVDAAQSMAAHE